MSAALMEIVGVLLCVVFNHLECRFPFTRIVFTMFHVVECDINLA